MTSEEEDDIIPVEEGYEGKYTLAFDPLDGSSNIDVNVSIGTIFSVHRRLSKEGQGTINDLLQPGRSQVAAGYILYGSSTMLVFTTGHGVQGFTLDPSVGEFYLSHADIKTAERARYVSVNTYNQPFWQQNVRDFFEMLNRPDKSKGRPYSSRYIGSLVADFHRNLITGGIFAYPRDSKDPGKPYGKLRLLYEAAPLAMLIEQAGGRAITDDGRNILDIEAEDLHQRVPLIIGSKLDVDEAEEFLSR
jgi:fructose-1,6-bisphosphatase I